MAIEALYLHIPFCHAKCAYCDFDSRALCGQALDAAAEAYVSALLRRLDAFGARGALDAVRTVYIGGGTPTALGDRLPALVRRVRRWCAPVELTCEANPESLTASLACGLARAGVTRISLGVQSLDDAELRQIGRIHTADEARAAVRRARQAGFDVSLDLMCGLPHQTPESWQRTIEGALALEAGHISVYPLTLEEGTPLARRVERGELPEPDEDFQAQCMEAAREAFLRAGFQPYEVASYARPGKACAHNIAYWTGVSYLGVGRSAAGMLSAGEFAGLADLFPGIEPAAGAARVRLVQRDDAGTRFEAEWLSAHEAVAEDLMLAMRMTAGAGRDLVERARAVFSSAFDRVAAIACTEGLAAWDAATGALAPTERGWLMGNELFGLMWGLAGEN